MAERFTLKYINEQHISANLYDNNTYIASVPHGSESIVDLLNELTSRIESYKNKSDMCEQYQKDVTNTLIKYHNYAQNQCGRNLDNIMVYSSYRLLVDTIRLIAKEIGVDLNG